MQNRDNLTIVGLTWSRGTSGHRAAILRSENTTMNGTRGKCRCRRIALRLKAGGSLARRVRRMPKPNPRRSRWPGRSAGCRPVPRNRARQKARQPASPRPRTRSSNPVPSSRQSVSRGISPSCIEKRAVAAACAGPARWHGRQRHARPVNITPIAGNVSVEPHSSTAMPPARFGDSEDTGPQQARCS